MTICFVILNVNLIPVNMTTSILIYYYQLGNVLELYNPIILSTKRS